MFFDILRDISRPHWIEILLTLKGSQGMAVRQIAEELDMSYMGIKQHCNSMEKLGYVDTWRHPQATGRPLKLYRLTSKCDPLFPDIGRELGLGLLASLRETMGPNAPEKFLHSFFAQKAEYYLKKVAKAKSTTDRAEKLAKLRTSEGYASRCDYNTENGLHLVESHSLLTELERAYPSVARMEEQMISKAMGSKVTRRIEKASGLERRYFAIKTL